MISSDDLSTNRHSSLGASGSSDKTRHGLHLTRHPKLSFSDGNLAVLTGDQYFLVHQGMLCRHSAPLATVLASLDPAPANTIDGRVTLELDDDADDMYYFLTALYDGIAGLTIRPDTFDRVSALLRLSKKYEVQHLYDGLFSGLACLWPTTLEGWERREASGTNADGVYEPRLTIPHPIPTINLARAIGAIDQLPSAFYDLSRAAPSDVAAGYTCSTTGKMYHLSNDDLMELLKGREHASRFLSTFIVRYLEGREPSHGCAFREHIDPVQRRACQAAFEAVTFDILRDVNGVVVHRSSDPLFAMLDADLMQGRADLVSFRTCDACHEEFGLVVDAARDEFWRIMPKWFGLEVPGWD
ncbi:hypothetical protein BD626DRAFT_473562 [Schizophyllum amplum]|uniref:BTB domain-containing protein n=1 Tax=Schizophyllum amplum TaxID=97359 RepID=A0A550CWW5_9AGAR|nr:hypothetical protein BD626DRAFT_473562 [Auriculariopsis ampla]